MSLPSYINLHSDNFFSQENLIQDLNTSYLLSLKESNGLSEKSTNINLRDDTYLTAMESSGNFVDLSPEARDKSENESLNTIASKTSNVCKVLRSSSLEYHMRNAIQFTYNATEKLYNPLCMRTGKEIFREYIDFLL